jgi:F-type H+-transporting ATPase subunit a
MIAQLLSRSSLAASAARFFALLAAFAFLIGSSASAQGPTHPEIEKPTRVEAHLPAGSEPASIHKGEAGAAHGAEHAEGGHKALPSAAPGIPGFGFFSSSMLVTWIVAAGIIIFAQIATKRIRSVKEAALQAPLTGAQNFWEFLVESLRNFLEQIIGRDLAKKTFWFFATVFIFILFTNWFGLLPGVGTIGWGHQVVIEGQKSFHVESPLLRGGNADLNMTAAMSCIFFVCWVIWGLQSNGPGGMIKHIFAPKGKSQGMMKILMIVVFLAVGLLEVISILFRPVSLSFRLYGNIFAGENLLESMQNVVPAAGWLIPLPFYFMELLVGLVQALVFMLLTAVFTLLICSHDEEHGDDHGAHPAKH